MIWPDDGKCIQTLHVQTLTAIRPSTSLPEALVTSPAGTPPNQFKTKVMQFTRALQFTKALQYIKTLHSTEEVLMGE
jgi:hypothetical protein